LVLFRNPKVSLLEAGLRERRGGSGEHERHGGVSGDGDSSGGGEGEGEGSSDGEAAAQRKGSIGARDGGEPRQKKKEQQNSTY
jgi:hypothetical protein